MFFLIVFPERKQYYSKICAVFISKDDVLGADHLVRHTGK